MFWHLDKVFFFSLLDFFKILLILQIFFFSVLMGCRVSLISSIKNLVILIGTIFLSQNNIESPQPVSDILPVYVFPLCTALNFYDFLYIFVTFLSVGLLLEIGHTHIFWILSPSNWLVVSRKVFLWSPGADQSIALFALIFLFSWFS